MALRCQCSGLILLEACDMGMSHEARDRGLSCDWVALAVVARDSSGRRVSRPVASAGFMLHPPSGCSRQETPSHQLAQQLAELLPLDGREALPSLIGAKRHWNGR